MRLRKGLKSGTGATFSIANKDIMDSDNSRLPEKTVSMLLTLPFEQVHLQMMKWILGVNKKTPNTAIYGDTGRYPLSIVCSKQLIDYF